MNKIFKKWTELIILGVLSFLFFSCATTVNVNFKRPAKLDLNGAKTIAVLPFKPYKYYKKSDSSSIGTRIIVDAFYQIFDVRDTDEKLSIDYLHTQIEKGLINSPYIKLVSSDSVEQAIKKGTLNPADVYLVGQVSYYDVDDNRHEERKLVKAATEDTLAEYEIVTSWKRSVILDFKYQIVDSSTQRIIAADEYRCEGTSSSYDSKTSLPSAYSIVKSDLGDLAALILRQLQPYTVTKSITLLELKTKDKALKKRMKAASEIASNHKLAEASEEFTKIYQETDVVEAGYNAAILQEALGNLSRAESMMSDLYNSHPDKRVANGLEDIQYEIRQAKRLQNQIKASEESEDLNDLDF